MPAKKPTTESPELESEKSATPESLQIVAANNLMLREQLVESKQFSQQAIQVLQKALSEALRASPAPAKELVFDVVRHQVTGRMTSMRVKIVR